MKINKMFIIISVSVLFYGCVRDDLDKCPSAERCVSFESVMRKYDFGDIIDHTTLYLYDAGNTLVFNRIYTVEDLVQNNYKAYVPWQEDGTYTLLASVNSGGDYLKKTPPELSGFEISLTADEGNTVMRKQRDIHHGFREISFREEDKDKDEAVCDVVRLYKNTNDIHVTLKGYDVPETHTLHGTIMSDNGAYDHRNVNIEGNDRIYMPYSAEAGVFDFKVMHIKKGSTAVFGLEEEIENGSRYGILAKDLMTEILKIYPTDDELDQVDIFDIEIVTGDGMVIIELLVNGWYTIRDGVDV